MYGSYYHTIFIIIDFEASISVVGSFLCIRIRDWLVNTHRERRVTDRTPYLYDRGLLQTWEALWNRLRRWEGRTADVLQPGRWFGSNIHLQRYCQNYCPLTKLYSLVSKCYMLLPAVKTGESSARTCVISNQGITPGGQSSNNLLFL